MAVTGAIGVLFVLGHMSGNLLMFSGQAAMHDYATLLRTSMPLLWAVRLVLIASVVLHIIAAVQLTRRSKAARPQGYEKRKPQVTTFAVRTIRIGGLILLLFIVFHILHMTTGTLHPDFVHLDPYNNLATGMRNPLVIGFYLLAMAALALHLYHGSWAVFRTLGLARASAQPLKRRLSIVIAIVIACGFAIIPIGVALGWFPESHPLVSDVSTPSATAGDAGTESAVAELPADSGAR